VTDVVLAVARDQLGRMRAMTALYHRRFFADIWLTVAVYLGVLAAGHLGAEPMFAMLAFVALFGAVVTAFDASYLIFARQYAARLETFINDRIGTDVLVGARLESAYLFPLDASKVVTIRFGRDFSWFGFVTVFFTFLGAAGYALGVVLALDALATAAARGWYLAALAPITVAALGTGVWWFAGGTGERRLRGVLDASFGGSPS
jgi:uncharacterized membrane protein YiaA